MATGIILVSMETKVTPRNCCFNARLTFDAIPRLAWGTFRGTGVDQVARTLVRVMTMREIPGRLVCCWASPKSLFHAHPTAEPIEG